MSQAVSHVLIIDNDLIMIPQIMYSKKKKKFCVAIDYNTVIFNFAAVILNLMLVSFLSVLNDALAGLIHLPVCDYILFST